jgi:hypothetical protein
LKHTEKTSSVAIYVDTLRNNGWRLGQNCHLFADSDAELHEFAKRIGLKRSWAQYMSLTHYDLTTNKRAQAVRAGAIEVDDGFVVEHIRRARKERKER